jgi:hypothetical protein
MDTKWIDSEKKKREDLIQQSIQKQRDQVGGHLDWRQEKFLEQVFRERLERIDATMTEASKVSIEKMKMASMKAAAEQGGTIKVEDEEKPLKRSPG